MVAHELATLNETREENGELKRTCEHLRKRNETLLERNVALKNTVQGMAIALNSLFAAMSTLLVPATYKAVSELSDKLANVSAPAKKRDRPSQVALVH